MGAQLQSRSLTSARVISLNYMYKQRMFFFVFIFLVQSNLVCLRSSFYCVIPFSRSFALQYPLTFSLFKKQHIYLVSLTHISSSVLCLRVINVIIIFLIIIIINIIINIIMFVYASVSSRFHVLEKQFVLKQHRGHAVTTILR